MACGEPAGCHCTKEEIDKKRKFGIRAAKIIITAVIVIVVYSMYVYH